LQDDSSQDSNFQILIKKFENKNACVITKITMEAIPNPVCLHCVNYNGDGINDDENSNCLINDVIENRPGDTCDEFSRSDSPTIVWQFDLSNEKETNK